MARIGARFVAPGANDARPRIARVSPLYYPVMSDMGPVDADLAHLRADLAASLRAREAFAEWLNSQENLAMETIDQFQSEQPDPLAPIDEQLAFMHHAAQVVARMELLAEMEQLVESVREEPVVVRVNAAELNALRIVADGLGLLNGQWGFDILLRPGCAQELVLVDDR